MFLYTKTFAVDSGVLHEEGYEHAMSLSSRDWKVITFEGSFEEVFKI